MAKKGAVGRDVRALLFAEIDKVAGEPRVLMSWGIDKDRWVRTVLIRMKRYQRCAFDEIAATCVAEYFKQRVAEFIRSSRDAAVENLTDVEEIKKSVKRSKRVVEVKQSDGSYVSKRESQCTPSELEVLADFHEGLGETHRRRASHYRLMAKQMRLAGFAETDPLSKYLAS